MIGKLILAIPSKGRLQEQSSEIFNTAGLPIERTKSRIYTGAIPAMVNVDVLFLAAAEIATRLEQGTIHLGLTGFDLISEQLTDPETCVDKLKPFDFGHADVVVAVPDFWLDVQSMADLDDASALFLANHGRRMRVATKFFNLTRRFFARHNIADYHIVESPGATEGAPASGAAELIVDITSTGATLANNNLRVLDDGLILRSQACLFASKTAPWSPTASTARNEIMNRLNA